MSNIENLQMNQIMGQEVGNYLHNGSQISLYEKRFISDEGNMEIEFIIYLNDERDNSNKYTILRKIYGDYSLLDTQSGKLLQPIRSLCNIYPNSLNSNKLENDDMTEQSSNVSYIHSIMDNSVETKTTVVSNNSDETDLTKVETYSEKVKNNKNIFKDNINIVKNKTTSMQYTHKQESANNSLDPKEKFLLKKREYKKEEFMTNLINDIKIHNDINNVINCNKDKLYINTINKTFLDSLKDGDWIFLKDNETIKELNKKVKSEINEDLILTTKDSIPKKDGKIFKELYLHNKYISI